MDGLVDPLKGKSEATIVETFVSGAAEMLAEERGLQESAALVALVKSFSVNNYLIHRFQALVFQRRRSAGAFLFWDIINDNYLGHDLSHSSSMQIPGAI